jgi:hypothetical protein
MMSQGSRLIITRGVFNLLATGVVRLMTNRTQENFFPFYHVEKHMLYDDEMNKGHFNQGMVFVLYMAVSIHIFL